MRPTNSSRRNRGRNNSGRRNGSGINHMFDNNGIENKLKGNAIQVHEKYLSLARDANSSGDTIKAESYLQHAEHYNRVHNSLQNVYTENNNLNEKNGKQKNIVLINTENSDQDEKISNGKLKDEVSLEKKVEAKTTKKSTEPDTKK